MDPAGLVLKLSSEAALVPFETPVSEHFVLAHHGVARCEEDGWTLTVDGLVDRDMQLKLADLRRLEQIRVTVALECAGNPQDPDKPTRFVGNARWGGVSLRHLLSMAGVGDGGRYVWLRGIDWGSYSGVENASYVKDIPIEKALSGDVLVAFEMNAAPLTAEHGFPLRAVVPGYYGTNSVKWLRQISVQSERPQSLFTTSLYNTFVDGVRTPVWGIAVNSRLTGVQDGDVLLVGETRQITGWAWSEDGVADVDVSVDGGETWTQAELDPQAGSAWQGFRLQWTPEAPGSYVLISRARDRQGRVQPRTLHINQTHAVSLTVRHCQPSGITR